MHTKAITCETLRDEIELEQKECHLNVDII